MDMILTFFKKEHNNVRNENANRITDLAEI